MAENRGSYYGEKAINVYDNAIKAIEKQIPKKPIHISTEFKEYGFLTGYCPICKEGVYQDMYYCDMCGQSLDWSEE